MVLRAVPASLYAFFNLHFSPGGSKVPPPSVDGFWRGCCGQPSQQLHGSRVMALQDSALLVATAPRPLSAHLVIFRSFQNFLASCQHCSRGGSDMDVAETTQVNEGYMWH
ncbi:unnamed protein product [Pocillopora meandrina]|uniref:Secreted protein n=1 Tax=Pocillopora meandrina TaxID=46732 RepID=A0AAU9XLN6_9CNID|nr:unnamed protein product [Pocillopora meandrina]